MIVRWLGHAAFSINLPGALDGHLCLDPHAPGVLGGRFALPEIQGPFDAVLITHRHEDHCAWRPSLGTDRMIDADGSVGPYDVRFRGVPHDAVDGRQMGWVRMASVDDGAHRVVHAGDLAGFSAADVAWLRGVDVLLVPVGGTYTLDGAGAAAFTRAVEPRWVVPMHGADPAIDLPLAPVSDFLAALGWPVAATPVLDLGSPPPERHIVLLAR